MFQDIQVSLTNATESRLNSANKKKERKPGKEQKQQTAKTILNT